MSHKIIIDIEDQKCASLFIVQSGRLQFGLQDHWSWRTQIGILIDHWSCGFQIGGFMLHCICGFRLTPFSRVTVTAFSCSRGCSLDLDYTGDGCARLFSSAWVQTQLPLESDGPFSSDSTLSHFTAFLQTLYSLSSLARCWSHCLLTEPLLTSLLYSSYNSYSMLLAVNDTDSSLLAEKACNHSYPLKPASAATPRSTGISALTRPLLTKIQTCLQSGRPLRSMYQGWSGMCLWSFPTTAKWAAIKTSK